MKFPMFALSAIGASLAMLSSAPAFAAAHTGKPMDSEMAASATPKGEKSVKNQDMATKPAMSGTSRAAVKSDARMAEKNGTALPAGENVTQIPGQKQTKGKMSSHESRRGQERSQDGREERDRGSSWRGQQQGPGKRPEAIRIGQAPFGLQLQMESQDSEHCAGIRTRRFFLGAALGCAQAGVG